MIKQKRFSKCQELTKYAFPTATIRIFLQSSAIFKKIIAPAQNAMPTMTECQSHQSSDHLKPFWHEVCL